MNDIEIKQEQTEQQKDEARKTKKKKFSYSKLSCFEQCGWHYKLRYVDKHFIPSDGIANQFGSLLHYVEECIAKDIIANDEEALFMIDIEKYKDLFMNANIEEGEEHIIGINKLKEKYPEKFYEQDKTGKTYQDKADHYLAHGIYSLQRFLKQNPDLKLLAAEQEFNLEYGEYVFHGSIDRVLQDKDTGQIILEDIKTWPDIKGHDVVTPLQFVFYSLAAAEIYNVPIEKIECYYVLPLLDQRHAAGTKNFIKRGLKKIDNLLGEISSENFEPKPSVLCYWCEFSRTYLEGQLEEAKNLCPYYCKWTKEKKDYGHEYEWMGIENHENILQAFIEKYSQKDITTKEIKENDLILKPLYLDTKENKRFFIIRR